MVKKYPLVLIIALIFQSGLVFAQEWRSELYPSTWTPPNDKNFYEDKMLQDFSYAGYHRGEKPIPVVEDNILDVTQEPYNADNTGAMDVTAILQQAIDDASIQGGGVVYLPEGTYRVSPNGNDCLKIATSNIVLRGDGPDKTFIFNSSNTMRNKSIIAVFPPSSSWYEGQNAVLITADLMSPTKVLPVQSVSGFKVGDLVIVRNNINENWINEHKMQQYWSGHSGSFPGIAYAREIMEVKTETNELVIDIPIRYALKFSENARVYLAPNMVSEVGIEELSIGNAQSFKSGWTEEEYNTAGTGAFDAHQSYVINMFKSVNSWITNVHSYQHADNTSGTHILSNGIVITDSKNVSVLNCEMKSNQFGGGGGNGYMFRTSANEVLFQDCVAEFNRHGFVISFMKASGNVFHRCIDIESRKQRGLTGNEGNYGGGSDQHMHFSHSNLYDKCSVTNSRLDAYFRQWGGTPMHGLTSAHSVYWNTTSNNNSNNHPYAVWSQQGRYGYVIGTDGTMPTIKLSADYAGSNVATDPVDHAEGEGEGSTLMPQSLYEDQLHRRMNPDPITSVEDEQSSTEFYLFPNPYKRDHDLKFKIPTGKKGNLIISDILGNILFSKFINDMAGSDDVSLVKANTFAKGVYVATFQTSKESKAFKLYVQ